MTPKYELNRPKKGIVYCVNNVDREFPNTKQVNHYPSKVKRLGVSTPEVFGSNLVICKMYIEHFLSTVLNVRK